MASVQFRGIKAILSAFDSMNSELWAIFDGKYLRFKGEGSEALGKLLKRISLFGSQAVYNLRVYDELPEGEKKITDKTPCDGSFNFKLFTEDEIEEDPKRMEYRERRSEMMETIAGIKDELRIMREQQLQPVEDESKLGIVGEIMQSPLGPVIGNILQTWFAPMAAQMQAQYPQVMGAIGNIPQPTALPIAATTINGGAAGNPMTLQQIIDGLRMYDPKIEQHLKKLLDLAINDNASFNFLLQTLDKM